jgi:ubiquinone/menaquinone biosynthesis C-methylase UbiE/DNA-binding transcriptional ArsR family regulator
LKLEACTELLKLLAEPARLRLLALLRQDELTVAELAQITALKQPRVSTHLAKLREAQLVIDRRAGVQAYYRAVIDQLDLASATLARAAIDANTDPLLKDDQKRLERTLKARLASSSWAEQVAGDMEKHYSPGRTWEAIARTLISLLELGDVLDIASGDGAMAELLAPYTRKLTCVDASEKVVHAAKQRLAKHQHIKVVQADMQALPFAADSFDLALMTQALPYADDPLQVFKSVRATLRPGAQLLGTALEKHSHSDAIAPFGHKNQGFTIAELEKLLSKAGYHHITVRLLTSERKAPHFDILIFTAKNP